MSFSPITTSLTDCDPQSSNELVRSSRSPNTHSHRRHFPHRLHFACLGGCVLGERGEDSDARPHNDGSVAFPAELFSLIALSLVGSTPTPRQKPPCIGLLEADHN